MKRGLIMSIGEWFRYLAFTGLDTISGQKVSDHLKELEAFFSNTSGDELDFESRITNLLKHTCDTVPYYRTFKGFASIYEYPVIDKATIKQRFNDFLSGKYKQSKLSKATTSGSYGTPTTYYLTPDKKARRFAEIVYFNNWAGYNVGMNHALIRARPKSKLMLFAENELLIRPMGIDLTWLEHQWRLMGKRSVKFIIGYPSILSMLARFYKDNARQLPPVKPKGVISFAEPLYTPDRNLIEEVFECPVLGRYSSEEFGVIAHECREEKRYHLNQASYLIELLDLKKDVPVTPGQPGRVIVTDLFSHAMPLIRYDTGDIAVMGGECSCSMKSKVFERIEGRMMESIYDTCGRLISPLVLVTPIARTIEGIQQFQFIQRGRKHYIIRLVVLPSFSKDKVHLIMGKLLAILGKDAHVELEYVSLIPALSSGKRPYFINELKTKSNQLLG